MKNHYENHSVVSENTRLGVTLNRKRVLFVSLSLLMFCLLFPFTSFSQNNWDGDGVQGNFSWQENWYDNTSPTNWNSLTDLNFNYKQNGSQTSLYQDLGWKDIRSLFYASSFPVGFNLDGNGGGFNFWWKVENNSSHDQSINIPLSLKGIAGELNAVNGNITFTQPIHNDNNKNFSVYNNNNKSVILSSYLVGNGSVTLTLKNSYYGFIKINANMPSLSSSSFSGGIAVNRGELWFNQGAAINGGTLTIGNGDANVCKLYINDSDGGTTVNNSINIPSNSTNSYIGGIHTSNTNTFSGAITGGSNANLESINLGGTIDFTGIISVSAAVYVAGSGTVQLSSSNTFTGATAVNSGTLKLGASGVIPDASALTITGTFDLAGFSETVGSLAGAGLVTSSAAGNPVLTAGGDNSNTSFSGAIQNGSSTTVGLTKFGTGTLTLSGTNTYTGSTLVSGGTLATSKSLSSSSISVSNMATFSVTDNISVNSITLDNGSTLNIANAKTLTVNGTLTLSGSVVISGGGTIVYGTNGVLTYNATNFSTTSDVEFPYPNGPKDLNITVASASGISLHANRTLAGNITIASGQIFIIPADKQFTVDGTITNNATAAGLVVKSGGSLIQKSAVSATVERAISEWGIPSNDHGWHFLSSPVSVQAISPNFANVTLTDNDFYCWWELTNEWVNFKNTTIAPTWNTANTSTNFNVGKGYLVEYAATSTKQFAGTLNVANVPISGLTISAGTNRGWHLLGNPFTSAIKWNDGNWGTMTNIAAGAKIWNESNASYSDIAANGIIPALNGFMVQVTSGTGSLTIPTAARVHDATAWYKSTNTPSILLVANDLDGQTAQESLIRFDNLATAGYDSDFDSHFLSGYAPKFYSLAGTEQLSTNTLPEAGGTVQVPLAFIKNNGTSFTIQAKTISNLFGPVILNDLKTNATQDLTVNPVYSFASESDDNPNRFLLTFSHLGLGDKKTDKSFTVTSSANSIIVLDNTGKNKGNVSVYNMMGQLVATSVLNGNASCKLNLNVSVGYYLVKVISSDQAYSTKVFINQR